MPRPRSFDTDAVIEQLCDYFWEHGYSATSLDELAQLLGVKRGSLFNAFGSKEVLFYAAFERYEQKFKLAFETDKSGVNAIANYFHNAIEIASTKGMGRGCFLVNLLMSAEIPTPELQQAIDLDVIFIKDFFHKHLELARLDGQLPPPISISAGVDVLFSATIGVFALARMRATPMMIQEFVKNNFRGLFLKV
ncbi:MAG: TetR/AcrR family transcriptional regulator [Microcoleus sp. PH2017_29_MFU_D_A]|jgi:TetR/AcrR family transcriptional regulator, transcriptional repressor for nem operon|uniref:TetR/AcrR family transcriptional regulator n=1 Tax=unclassified Microcoleus TaxID=2642155 RepID=UPI001DB7523C|nr:MULTISPECIES: TetR/AcrR family transcriptional regulator [unclassified Microcoleus]MCC3421779.1 TetR/AcrR family transcriptional regulator [Microcoleus sp. PH2017_07_MST_O_A]MCC3432384.1 TetR/AcrR family transcriptional regulator [Microcoleus sp. PH2017_04_SCI_O_A]MCC3444428.1 TetR/AcrR family transcriptional regulator [Microcoleus sp. PH2017_03_ELD_O_A]MCC3469095.1 TetR/AcrR family transcriptional regulator [Microcoleus sp. PH2017_06_SFM_O_A]MCC3507346.1 TetR/AcrR family transcriptional re